MAGHKHEFTDEIERWTNPDGKTWVRLQCKYCTAQTAEEVKDT